MKNTWGLQFTEVNHETQEFITHKALNIGDEKKTNELFEKLKSTYKSPEESNFIIDILDEEDSIVDDHSISKEDFIKFADDLGHEIKIM